MKDAKEILFKHYQQGEDGGLKLTMDDILQAMDEMALEVLTAYILVRTGCHSEYEAKLAAKVFLESNPF